jgi:hypothetical protein
MMLARRCRHDQARSTAAIVKPPIADGSGTATTPFAKRIPPSAVKPAIDSFLNFIVARSTHVPLVARL